jgi:hypothetical protein
MQEHPIEEFVRECELALEELRHATARMARIRHRIPNALRVYYTSHPNRERSGADIVHQLFLAESSILQRLLAGARGDSLHGHSPEKLLKDYVNVGEADALARAAKVRFPEYLLDLHLDNRSRLRSAIRGIVSSHRDLLEGIRSASGRLREDLHEPTRTIEEALHDAKWLFEIPLIHSHEDMPMAQELLRSMEEEFDTMGFYIWWPNRDVRWGEDWSESTGERLTTADAAIVLVSPKFMKSKFIMSHILPILLKRRQAHEMILLPIMLEEFDWTEVEWLRSSEFLPRGGKLADNYSSAKDRKAFYEQVLAAEVRALLRWLCDPEAQRLQETHS